MGMTRPVWSSLGTQARSPTPKGQPAILQADDNRRTDCQPFPRPLRGYATQGPFGLAALSRHEAARLIWSRRSKEKRQKPGRVGRVIGILILLLFPFPLALLITSG